MRVCEPHSMTNAIHYLIVFYVLFLEDFMEFQSREIMEVEKIAKDADLPVRELGELELSLVGGGSGDVAF